MRALPLLLSLAACAPLIPPPAPARTVCRGSASAHAWSPTYATGNASSSCWQEPADQCHPSSPHRDGTCGAREEARLEHNRGVERNRFILRAALLAATAGIVLGVVIHCSGDAC